MVNIMINEPTLTETRNKLETEIATLKEHIEYRVHMLESLADIEEYRIPLPPVIKKETGMEGLGALFG